MKIWNTLDSVSTAADHRSRHHNSTDRRQSQISERKSKDSNRSEQNRIPTGTATEGVPTGKMTFSYSLDLQGAASPMEVEGELPDMNAEEMAKEGFYLLKSVIRHPYRQGWCFLTLWERFGVEEATWEPFFAFMLPEGHLNSVRVDYLSQNNLGELLRLAKTLASQKKPKD